MRRRGREGGGSLSVKSDTGEFSKSHDDGQNYSSFILKNYAPRAGARGAKQGVEMENVNTQCSVYA